MSFVWLQPNTRGFALLGRFLFAVLMREMPSLETHLTWLPNHPASILGGEAHL